MSNQVVPDGVQVQKPTLMKRVKNLTRLQKMAIPAAFFALCFLIVAIVVGGQNSKIDKNLQKALTIGKAKHDENKDTWTDFVDTKAKVEEERTSFDLFYMYGFQNAEVWMSVKGTCATGLLTNGTGFPDGRCIHKTTWADDTTDADKDTAGECASVATHDWMFRITVDGGDPATLLPTGNLVVKADGTHLGMIKGINGQNIYLSYNAGATLSDDDAIFDGSLTEKACLAASPSRTWNPTKLDVKQYGPYAYQKFTKRSNFVFGTSSGEETIEYQEDLTAKFDSAKSKDLGCVSPSGNDCDPKTDMITSLNPTLLGGSGAAGSETVLGMVVLPALMAAQPSVCPLIYTADSYDLGALSAPADGTKQAMSRAMGKSSIVDGLQFSGAWDAWDMLTVPEADATGSCSSAATLSKTLPLRGVHNFTPPTTKAACEGTSHPNGRCYVNSTPEASTTTQSQCLGIWVPSQRWSSKARSKAVKMLKSATPGLGMGGTCGKPTDRTVHNAANGLLTGDTFHFTNGPAPTPIIPGMKLMRENGDVIGVVENPNVAAASSATSTGGSSTSSGGIKLYDGTTKFSYPVPKGIALTEKFFTGIDDTAITVNMASNFPDSTIKMGIVRAYDDVMTQYADYSVKMGVLAQATAAAAATEAALAANPSDSTAQSNDSAAQSAKASALSNYSASKTVLKSKHVDLLELSGEEVKTGTLGAQAGGAPSGGADYAFLDAGASSDDDAYNGMLLTFTNDIPTGAKYQHFVVADYDGTTKKATWSSTTSPAAVSGTSSTTFAIHRYQSSVKLTVTSSVVTTQAVLSALFPPGSNVYNGKGHVVGKVKAVNSATEILLEKWLGIPLLHQDYIYTGVYAAANLHPTACAVIGGTWLHSGKGFQLGQKEAADAESAKRSLEAAQVGLMEDLHFMKSAFIMNIVALTDVALQIPNISSSATTKAEEDLAVALARVTAAGAAVASTTASHVQAAEVNATLKLWNLPSFEAVFGKDAGLQGKYCTCSMIGQQSSTPRAIPTLLGAAAAFAADPSTSNQAAMDSAIAAGAGGLAQQTMTANDLTQGSGIKITTANGENDRTLTVSADDPSVKFPVGSSVHVRISGSPYKIGVVESTSANTIVLSSLSWNTGGNLLPETGSPSRRIEQNAYLFQQFNSCGGDDQLLTLGATAFLAMGGIPPASCIPLMTSQETKDLTPACLEDMFTSSTAFIMTQMALAPVEPASKAPNWADTPACNAGTFLSKEGCSITAQCSDPSQTSLTACASAGGMWSDPMKRGVFVPTNLTVNDADGQQTASTGIVTYDVDIVSGFNVHLDQVTLYKSDGTEIGIAANESPSPSPQLMVQCTTCVNLADDTRMWSYVSNVKTKVQIDTDFSGANSASANLVVKTHDAIGEFFVGDNIYLGPYDTAPLGKVAKIKSDFSAGGTQTIEIAGNDMNRAGATNAHLYKAANLSRHGCSDASRSTKTTCIENFGHWSGCEGTSFIASTGVKVNNSGGYSASSSSQQAITVDGVDATKQFSANDKVYKFDSNALVEVGRVALVNSATQITLLTSIILGDNDSLYVERKKPLVKSGIFINKSGGETATDGTPLVLDVSNASGAADAASTFPVGSSVYLGGGTFVGRVTAVSSTSITVDSFHAAAFDIIADDTELYTWKTTPGDPVATAQCLMILGQEIAYATGVGGTGTAVNDVAKFLAQLSLLAHTVQSQAMIAGMGAFWQQLVSIVAAISFIPASVRTGAGATAATVDGLVLRKPMHQWYTGFRSPLSASLTGKLWFSGFGAPERTGESAACSDPTKASLADCKAAAAVAMASGEFATGPQWGCEFSTTITTKSACHAAGKAWNGQIKPSTSKKKFMTGTVDVHNIKKAAGWLYSGDEPCATHTTSSDCNGDSACHWMGGACKANIKTHFENFKTGNNPVGAFPDPDGMKVEGYDGKSFPPQKADDFRSGKNHPSAFKVWVSQGYQPVMLSQTEKNFDVKGIKTNLYQLPPSELTSTATNRVKYRGIQLDYCKCTPKTGVVQGNCAFTPCDSSTCDSTDCDYSKGIEDTAGMLDLKVAGGLMHSTLTQPHFINGDQRLRSHVTLDGAAWPTYTDGSADKAKYEMFLAVDKLLGAVIKGENKLQANFVIDGGQLPISCSAAGHSNAYNVPGTCPTQINNPIYWLSESGELSDKKAKDLKALHDDVTLASTLVTVFWALFAVFFLLTLFGALYERVNKKKVAAVDVNKDTSAIEIKAAPVTMTDEAGNAPLIVSGTDSTSASAADPSTTPPADPSTTPPADPSATVG